MPDSIINEFRQRRAERLRKRGIRPLKAKQYRRSEGAVKISKKELLKDLLRLDAPDGEEEQNNSGRKRGGGGAGGHGNTRLPFGLCKRYGIDIDPSWGPKDAWDALAGKGITPEGAYAKLRKGEDPGTPDVTPEPPKEPVKKITAKDGTEYDKLKGSYVSWASRGTDPWRLEGEKVDGTGEEWGRRRLWMRFWTKTDMLTYLKEKGVEEFEDPETHEIINPKEMELPKAVFTRDHRGYTEISVGLRKGKYSAIGTDFDGKKKTLRDFDSLKDAQDWFEQYGAKAEDIKLSPSLKKREKERVAWLTSDKKEYFVSGDGKKYGDISLSTDGARWSILGESEDGVKRKEVFFSRAEAIKFLKDQGVEKIREGKESVNPQEFEVPEAKFTIKGRPYIDAGIKMEYGDIVFYCTDLDGKTSTMTRKYSWDTMGEFKESLESDYGVSIDQLTIDNDTKAKIAEIEKEEEERERRRKEFAAKAIDIPGKGKYADVFIKKDSDGDMMICGYDYRGRESRISYYGDMYEMEREAERYGLSMQDIVKDEEVKKDYERYLEAKKDFDAKATEIAGVKYADLSVEYRGGHFRLMGMDARGRKQEVAVEDSYEGLEKTLNQYGLSPTMFTMDDEAEKRKEKAIRAKNALASGGYYSLGKKDSAYKDIRVEEDDVMSNMWKIIGTDVDGNESIVESVKSWDDAITKMADYGVADYKLKDKSGAELKKPAWGMHKVMLMRKPGGGFLVYADSKRYGKHAIMYETPKEEEARKWMRDNGVPDGTVKTRGMNPNDDVIRAHTAKSLDKFDSYRMTKIENSIIDKLTEQQKKDAVDMLTEVFSKGKLRSARGLSHFGDIIETGYKSQIETGTGGHGACLSKSMRKRCSDIMYGHGGLGDTEYEKMGYVGLDDDAEDYDHGRPSYGEMTFTFKKDKLKDRVTYSYGDSLNTDGHLACAGYGGDKPTIEGMTSLYSEDYIKRAINAFKEYKDGKMSYVDMFDQIRRNANNRYIEIQMHGPVTVEDIDTATFYSESNLDRAFSKMGKKQRKNVIKLLRDNNVKVVYRKDRYNPFEDAWGYLRTKFPDDFED